MNSVLLILVTGADCRLWQPESQLRSAFLRDFVNSKNVPTTTPGSSSLSSTAVFSDDVSRGGHASVKALEEAVDKITSQDQEIPIQEENIKTLNMNVEIKSRSKRKPISGSKKIAMKLKNRNHTNIRRKVMHAAFGVGFAVLNHFIPKDKFVPGMAVLSAATLLMELLRYKKGFNWMNTALHATLGSSLRKHEMEGKFTGSFYFFVGVTITAALYPTTCATLGILQLALADPSASYFGRHTRHVYWSRIGNGLGGFGRNKGLLGFLGGALFCFPFNYQMLSSATFPVAPAQSSIYAASMALGLAGAFADLAVPTPALTLPKKILGRRVPPFHVDDNFVVPIFSAYAATHIFKNLGWNPDAIKLSKFFWL